MNIQQQNLLAQYNVTLQSKSIKLNIEHYTKVLTLSLDLFTLFNLKFKNLTIFVVLTLLLLIIINIHAVNPHLCDADGWPRAKHLISLVVHFIGKLTDFLIGV